MTPQARQESIIGVSSRPLNSVWLSAAMAEFPSPYSPGHKPTALPTDDMSPLHSSMEGAGPEIDTLEEEGSPQTPGPGPASPGKSWSRKRRKLQKYACMRLRWAAQVSPPPVFPRCCCRFRCICCGCVLAAVTELSVQNESPINWVASGRTCIQPVWSWLSRCGISKHCLR